MTAKSPRRGARLQQSWAAAPAAQPSVQGAQGAGDMGVALQHLMAGRLQQAETLFRRIIETEPNHYGALHGLGVMLHQAGQKDAANELIGRAVAVKPTFWEAHNSLGNVLADLGRIEEAAACFQRAVALRPDSAEAHCNLATMLYEQGKLDEAIASYRRAIALNTEIAEAHSNLGTALTDQGRFEDAVASCRNAIVLKPDFAEAHNSLGTALDKLGKFDDAAACFRKAIALDPGYAEAHNNLGNALKHRGNRAEAAACFERAIAIRPSYIDAHYNYVRVHEFVPDDPEIGRLKELLVRDDLLDDHRTLLLFSLGKAHDDVGSYDLAFSYYSKGNDANNQLLGFDASRHRRDTAEIKNMFRDRRDASGRTSGTPERVPVFVVGVSRSGKTLVESLLSQHEDVHGCGENAALSDSVNAVCEKYAISSVLPEFGSALTDEHIDEIGSMYMEKIIQGSPASEYLVNTMPGNYKYIPVIFGALSSAKIIYCHRDPVDTCLFVYFTRYAHGNEHSYDLANVGSYYAAYDDLMAHWRELYGDRILSVRYEDMVRNPTDAGARIFRFCGLDYDPGALESRFTTDEIGHWKHYAHHLAPLRQALGLPVEQSNTHHGNGDSNPIELGTDEPPPLQQRRFTAAAPQPGSNSGTVKAALTDAIRYHQTGEVQKAEGLYKGILEAEPNQPEALHFLGVIALQSDAPGRAVDLIGKAVAADPSYAKAHSNLGVALAALDRHDEAIAAHGKAIALEPSQVDAHFNLGVALADQGKLDAAMNSFRKAIALKSGHADAHHGLGVVLKRLDRLTEATESFDRAIDISPNDRAFRYSRAQVHLLLGDFGAGWRDYLARRSMRHASAETHRDPLEPELSGKRLFVVKDQGIGDELFFLRFAPQLKARGAEVVYHAGRKVAAMVERLPFVDRLAGPEDDPATFDLVLSVGDLPYLLGMNEARDIPRSVELSSLPARLAEMRDRLASLGPAPYIGVTWRGGTDKPHKLSKRAPLERLASALRPTGGTVVVLQRIPAAGEIDSFAAALGRDAHDLTALNDDLEGMLALVDLLDDYVCVSNLNVQLRAARGRTCRVLIPHPPEFRWMASGDESPWFPGTRLYRQTVEGDWEPALAALERDLSAAWPAG